MSKSKKPSFRYYLNTTKKFYGKWTKLLEAAKSGSRNWVAYKVYDDGRKVEYQRGEGTPNYRKVVGYVETYIHVCCGECGEVSRLEAWKWNWTIKKLCPECKVPRVLIRPQAKGNWKVLGFSSYYAYLRSDLWKKIRKRVLHRDGHKCRLCGERANQVHHKSYHIDVLRGLNDKPLVSICHKCHESIEFSAEGEKNRLDQANAELRARQAFPQQNRRKNDEA